MVKIRRNDPCRCGSGKKYKKCCLKLDEAIPEVMKIIAKNQIEEKVWKEKYGEVRPFIHTEHQGNKFVAVGDGLYYSPSWKTVPDFLVAYLGHVLDNSWCNMEISKPFNDRHQILKWYDGMCNFQKLHTKKTSGLYRCVPNGDFSALIHLAYDLYVIRHNSTLQNQIIRKLKNKQEFQGARYELFAAATCIRAGFTIEYENEGDVTRKHPEFVATHKATGQNVLVEAKSRHRPGVLDFPGQRQKEEDIKTGVCRLLREALLKSGNEPYVIFIDLNMPPSIRLDQIDREIKNTIDIVCGDNSLNPDKFNLVIFTNHPHQYGLLDEDDPRGASLMVYSQNPLIAPTFPKALVDISEAANKYGNIPNSFDEYD